MAIFSGSRQARAVGFIQSGTGAVAESLQTKIREFIPSVFDFFTDAQKTDVQDRTAAVNVLSAIQTAITAHKRLRFPAGTYNLGELSGSTEYFDFTSKGNDISIVADGVVRFVFTRNAATNSPFLFSFANSARISIQGTWHFQDTGSNVMVAGTSDGVFPFKFGASCTDVDIGEIHTNNCSGALQVIGTAGTSKRFKIGLLNLYRCWYGLNCQNNGDDITAVIHATESGRAYFPYGIENHDITLTEEDPSSVRINIISRYDRNTRNIKLRMKGRLTAAIGNHRVQISHLNGDGANSIIENINIEYDYDAPTTASDYAIVILYSYQADQTTLNTTNVTHVTRNLTLKGNKGGHKLDFYSNYTKTAGQDKGLARWNPDARYNANWALVMHQSLVFAWTPTLSNGWAVGNGTARGFYKFNDDGSLDVWGTIIFGSTSTFGTAQVPQITLPTIDNGEILASGALHAHTSTDVIGTARFIDTGTASYQASLVAYSAAGDIYLGFYGWVGPGTSGLDINNTTPFTWASGDEISFHGTIARHRRTETAP